MRLRRREAGDDRAVAADIVDIGDALAAAAGTAIFIGRRQLAIAIGADGEDELFAPRQLCETLVGHRVGAVLLRLPRGEAQIILELGMIANAAAESEETTSELQALMRNIE